MSITEIITLCGIMIALSAIPSASVALVVTRSATAGVANGMAVAAGIVLGDMVFVWLALLGLSVMAETMGGLFMVIRYLGAGYLIWLGLSLFISRDTVTLKTRDTSETGSLIGSLLAGLLLTLGDVKAIFFYASLFPMYIDSSTLQTTDMMAIMLVTIGSVGGVKVLYALWASRIASLAMNARLTQAARKSAGGMMIGAGGYLMLKS